MRHVHVDKSIDNIVNGEFSTMLVVPLKVDKFEIDQGEGSPQNDVFFFTHV